MTDHRSCKSGCEIIKRSTVHDHNHANVFSVFLNAIKSYSLWFILLFGHSFFNQVVNWKDRNLPSKYWYHTINDSKNFANDV